MTSESAPKGEEFEAHRSRIEDPQFIAEFFAAYANALEEKVTASDSRFSDEELKAVEEFSKIRKLPHTKSFYETLVKVAQDFRFTPDEIDVLADRFLKK
ncbi:MAG: hypothetical protein HY455_01865 [Parcubacteria group bacterium]|nr:hypothetical protein [Parcubacteria group bacterium]